MVTFGEEYVSSCSRGGICDVFLSFRYEDVGKKFAGYLQWALYHSGFHIFGQNADIKRGENIKFELQRAIKESEMSIIVFSKGYASSSWCLDELVMILQHKKTSSGDHHILPIFYDVAPSHVRWQTGSFKEIFESYEEGQRENGWKSRVEGWKAALREAANLSGMDLQNDANGHEAKFIEKIVEEVRDKLRRRILSLPVYLTGINSRAKFILSWLNNGSRDVGMLAICGIGGLGKTTIAKFVYNRSYSRFQGSSFLANIAEVSKQQSGLIDLQTQLLSDIMKGRGERVNNVHEGVVKIQFALKHKSVLLILDDVGTQEQMEAIVGICDWLHTGSKIIITTRNEQVVQAHKACVVYRLQILNSSESLELFNKHAFGQNKLEESFKEISERLANHCGGLPLAIKIVGSSLLGKSLSIWESQFKKLAAIPDCAIHEKLKISFDLLDDHDKQLFLHVACFFLGYDRDYVVSILDRCGFFTIVGFENLIDKCLLKIQSKFSCQAEKQLEMHQLLQEMGRQIVRQESPKDPGNRSRIWDNNDSLHILREKSGTINIEGLILNMQKSENKASSGNRKRHFLQAFDKSIFSNLGNSIKRRCYGSWYSLTSTTSENSSEMTFEIDAFAVMRNLKFLVFNYVQLHGDYKNFPKGLRWLCWHGSPLQSIPNDFCLEELVILEMPDSSLRSVWTGTKQCDSIYRGGSKHEIPHYDDMEFNIFTTHFPGSEIPGWYNFKEKGSSIYLNVPFDGDNITIQGLNVCFVYALPCDCIEDKGFQDEYPFMTMVDNQSTGERFCNGYRWFSGVSQTSQDMIDLSYWKFNRDGVKGGDILFIQVCRDLKALHNVLEVKEIGVRILFREEKGKSLQFTHDTKSILIAQGRRYFPSIQRVRLHQISSATKAVNIPLKVWYSFRGSEVMTLHPENEEMVANRFAAYLPESEVPRWCNIRSKGASIELTLPSYNNGITILGFQVCSIFTLLHNYQDIYYDNGQQHMASVNNKSTGEFWNNMYKWVVGVRENCSDIMQLSYWEFVNDKWELGDKLNIQVFANNEYFKVKEIGVQITYTDPKERFPPEVCVRGEPYASIHIYRPDNYKFKLNTYEYEYLYEDRRYIYGGVFRDAEGKWILGYYGRLEESLSDLLQDGFSYERKRQAQCWAIYKGLTIILEKGWSNVFIQSNDWEAVEELYNITTSDVRSEVDRCYTSQPETSDSRNIMMKDILSLRSRCNCTLSYITPERNKLAKLIAELGKGSDDELVVLENPPDDLEIKGILLAEMKMKTFA